MKRAFVLAAVLVTAAALNGTADAARWNGVIVAKDAKRKAVVTVYARVRSDRARTFQVQAPARRATCRGQRAHAAGRYVRRSDHQGTGPRLPGSLPWNRRSA